MRLWGFATQQINLKGLSDAAACGCFPALFSGRMAALYYVLGLVPVMNFQLKNAESSTFALGLRALW